MDRAKFESCVVVQVKRKQKKKTFFIQKNLYYYYRPSLHEARPHKIKLHYYYGFLFL